jgi:hypothetical protein
MVRPLKKPPEATMPAPAGKEERDTPSRDRTGSLSHAQRPLGLPALAVDNQPTSAGTVDAQSG